MPTRIDQRQLVEEVCRQGMRRDIDLGPEGLLVPDQDGAQELGAESSEHLGDDGTHRMPYS